VIALRREEIGVLVMELSESFWPEDLELAVLAAHDIARSRQNSLLLLVVLHSDFDTPLWDFLPQILQPGILAPESPFPSCSVDTESRRAEKQFEFVDTNAFLWPESGIRGESVAFVIRDSSLFATDTWVKRPAQSYFTKGSRR
jgi:hypothetical protein